MSKYKNGEHIALSFEDHPGWEAFKGWHSEKDCQAELDEDEMKVTGVTHAYGKWSPGFDEMGDFQLQFEERKKPGRGRFKVTLAAVQFIQ